MSSIFRALAVGHIPKRFSLRRWFGRTDRLQKLDLLGVSDEVLRDLGFCDGRIYPPRDPLRD